MSEPPLRRVLAPNPSPLTGEGTNTWILGRGAVAVIDPGPDDPRHLTAILDTLGAETVSHILVTHAHRDHSGLAPRLAAATGAPVLAYGDARAGWSARMLSLEAAGLQGGEGLDTTFLPDRCLSDDEVVEGRGWQLRALHTPGHLGGHLCLCAGGILFTGDHVMGWSTSVVAPPEGDMGAYMASLARLACMAPGRWHRALPGHGPVIEDPAARIAELLAHRRGREAAILDALASTPADSRALTKALYPGLPPGLHRAAESNVLAHLLDLESRSLVLRVSEDGAPTPDGAPAAGLFDTPFRRPENR